MGVYKDHIKDALPSIKKVRDYKKKGDKYFRVTGDGSEYFKIVDGVLQLWDKDGNTNYIYEPIDW